MKKHPFFRLKQQFSNFLQLLSNEKIRENLFQGIPFWIASLLTGLVAVGYARLFSYAEHLSRYIAGNHQRFLFLLMPLCFVLGWWLVKRFAPGAKGSGIPQVMAAIDLATPEHFEKVNKLLGFRIIVTKIVSSLVMVLGGASVGREGPTIQIAGSVFHIVNRWIPRSWPKLSGQNFILTGAAAGLAAAFNTPLGGVVFAMEELARTHIRYFRTALFFAVIIAGLTAQGLLGPYLYLGYPNVSSLRYSIFLAVAFTAIAAGLCAGVLCKLILKFLQWRDRLDTPLKNILFLAGSGLLMAAIACFISPNILGSGKELMSDVLFSADKQQPWYTVFLRMTGTLVSFVSGAAGGVFAPALAAGATLGAGVASLFHFAGANANILILSGMVGFLTGVTRTPFTSAILVLEMTDRHSVIFHLMLAALIAYLAALLIDKHSLYEHLKQQYLQKALAESTQ